MYAAVSLVKTDLGDGAKLDATPVVSIVDRRGAGAARSPRALHAPFCLLDITRRRRTGYSRKSGHEPRILPIYSRC